MATPALLRRFWPYMARYKGILCFDLFCAALTSVCELVLPLIMRSITNMGVNDLSSLTVSYILRVGALYLVLRLIDGAANYFMANTGHVMARALKRICAETPLTTCKSCPTAILPIPRWARSWGASPTTCLM